MSSNLPRPSTPEATARAIAKQIRSGYYGSGRQIENIAAYVEREVAATVAAAVEDEHNRRVVAEEQLRMMTENALSLKAALAAAEAPLRTQINDLQHRLIKLEDYAIPMYQNLVAHLRRSRAERVAAAESKLAEVKAILEAVNVALKGQAGVTDFELSFPVVRRTVDVLAALNRANALLTLAEERLAAADARGPAPQAAQPCHGCKHAKAAHSSDLGCCVVQGCPCVRFVLPEPSPSPDGTRGQP